MADLKTLKNKAQALTAELFAHRVIVWWLPLLYFLISSLFYLRTYDSAQVKITVMQMGGLAVLTLWIVRLVEAGGAAFTKDDLVTLSPFFAYLLVGILSYMHAPYHMASTDFFLRHCFYMTVALVAVYELDQPAADRLTRVLIWTGWVAILYGFWQVIDTKYFPAGPGKGIDPFIWRGAFGERVFSTYGNPNFFADFLVIIFPILLTQYFKKPRVSLIVLMALLVIDLIQTGTKGAWLGFAIVIAIFGAIAVAYFKKLLNSQPLPRTLVTVGLTLATIGMSAVGVHFVIYHRWILAGICFAGALGALSAHFFNLIRTYTRLIVAVAVLGALGFVGYVGKDLETRIVSVNFRLFTWEATWEMIRTQPIIGTGIGSFPPVYPAFRRPPIFHIEGKHNTETDHSEDEYLEEWFDNGLLGFGIFLWLIVSTLVIGFRSLGQMTSQLADRDGRPPGRAYDLIGYLVAFMGMLGHNCFDVSMRFVSSGVYLGLLSGMVVNLARGKGLYELHDLREAPKPAGPPAKGAQAKPAPAERTAWQTLSEFLIWPARFAAWGGLAYTIFVRDWSSLQKLVPPGTFQLGGIIGDFQVLQGPYDALRMGGEQLQWILAWAVLLGCVLVLGYFFAKLVLLTENPVVPLIILVSLQPLWWFWGYFKADIHHNIAIYYSKERNWDQALHHYQIVHELNPDFVMSEYFMGNVFNDRFDMDKVYNPMWGDKDGVARDDYERALASYDEVRRLAPNYVQMHHQVGALHMKRAEWAMQHGHPEEAQLYLDRAMTRFRLYEAIDPVFAPNYYRMGQIYMIEKKYDLAAKVYEDYIRADKCAVSPSLMKHPWLRRTILSYQTYVQEPGSPYPVHRHESAEAYTNLANAYYLGQHLGKAEAAYRHALALDPNFDQAKRNLSVVYGKAKSLGRLRKIAAPQPGAGPGPFTGYEIVPAKR